VDPIRVGDGRRPYLSERVRVAAWLDVLADAHGLKCAAGDSSACSGTCEHRAGFYLGRPWSRCPVAELNDDARLRYVLTLEHHAKLSPLAGWPDDFAAWVPSIWSSLVQARAARQAHSSRGN